MTSWARPVVVGVAGGSGSGKSTFVQAVRDTLDPGIASVLRHDAYYRDMSHLPDQDRARVNFDHPDALETDLLTAHVGRLLEGKAVAVPVYDFTTHTRTERTSAVQPTPVLILDGILVLADEDLRATMDLKVYVDADADTRLARRLRRDVDRRGRSAASVRDQYQATVKPMHDAFVEPTKRHADVVVRGGGRHRAAVHDVATRIQRLLAERGSTRDPAR